MVGFWSFWCVGGLWCWYVGGGDVGVGMLVVCGVGMLVVVMLVLVCWWFVVLVCW